MPCISASWWRSFSADMIEIQVNGLVKSFEVGHNVLDGLTFQIDQGERVGLLGKNGAGKSTLFKILTGELDYDEGSVTIGQGRRMGLISQIPVYPAGYTVEDVLRTAFSRLQTLAEEMESLAERMAAGDSDPAVLRRYGKLSEKFEAFGGYDTDVAVNKIANGLSISQEMRSQLFDSLSGGEKTRVNLGRLILEDTDILLLDEPTNHLDLHATEWLEEYIRGFKGTVVVISSPCMGTGSDELGAALMKSFIFALTQQDTLPKSILFYNGGAKLTTEGSASLEDLKSLEAQGVEILTCGTCLNFFGLGDKLQVGGVTNMYDIVEKMSSAGRVVRP